MSDVENPPVTTEEALVPRHTGGSLLDRWVEAGPEQALARVDALVKTLEVLRVASIRATYLTDWLIHVSTDRDGNVTRAVGYLQDCGAERAGKVWGIDVGAPVITLEEHPDGTYSYHSVADAWSKVTGERVEHAEGSRWSGSRFFERKLAADEKVDPTLVRKSAYANLHGRCVRALGGLSAVPPDVLRQAGLDPAKILHIGYETGAKGGESTGAQVGGGEVTVGFGNSRGKAPAQLEDKDLAWYLKAYAENVADAGKAKFLKANQRVLDALKVEQERRVQATAHEAETGTKAEEKPKPAAPVEMPAASKRGKKVGDAYTKLHDATKGDGKVIAAVLRLVSKDFGTETAILSEVSEQGLDKILAAPESILADLIEQAKKAVKEEKK